jgi:DNA-binding transcriptional LysR family regulator
MYELRAEAKLAPNGEATIVRPRKVDGQARARRAQQLPTQRIAFGLSSEQCELLATFEIAGTLSGLATLLAKDVSVVSRQLQRVARTAPVLEKTQGRWRLTSLGHQINAWTHDVCTSQKTILKQRAVLRIASTREFASRVLAPNLAELLGEETSSLVSVATWEDGVEKILLSGGADLGFDCGRPTDPSVRFKTVQSEAFVVVASPAFLQRHPVKKTNDVLELPHLQYQRASASRLLSLSCEVPNVLAVFNDVASVREACVAGLGWTVLPLYAVRRELHATQLTLLPGWNIHPEQFGVWWLRGQSAIEPWVQRAIEWLGQNSLS